MFNLAIRGTMGHADRGTMGHADRGTMGHADRGTMGHLIIVPWSLLLVCLPKKLVEMLLKSTDIAIFDFFVKY